MDGKKESNLNIVNSKLNETIFFNKNGGGTEVQLPYIPLANLSLTVRFNNVLKKTTIKTLLLNR